MQRFDAGQYMCRVDFRQSPTVYHTVELEVIGESQYAMNNGQSSDCFLEVYKIWINSGTDIHADSVSKGLMFSSSPLTLELNDCGSGGHHDLGPQGWHKGHHIPRKLTSVYKSHSAGTAKSPQPDLKPEDSAFYSDAVCQSKVQGLLESIKASNTSNMSTQISMKAKRPAQLITAPSPKAKRRQYPNVIFRHLRSTLQQLNNGERRGERGEGEMYCITVFDVRYA